MLQVIDQFYTKVSLDKGLDMEDVKIKGIYKV